MSSASKHLTKKEMERILLNHIDELVAHLKYHGCTHSAVDILKTSAKELVGDYDYIFKDILAVLGDKELSTLEVAKGMHMAMTEVWSWLQIMEHDKKLVASRVRTEDQRYVWKRVQQNRRLEK